MKKFLLASAATAAMSGAVFADHHGEAVKLGVLMGFTGPLESLAPPIAAGAELAMAEVTASGQLLGGRSVESVRGDSTCIDASAATAAAERVVTSDNVDGIIGAMCSGATTAVLTNVAMPNGIVQFSPSASSPALSTLEDNGLFFRAAPSDARQGVVMAEIVMERGISEVAVTYTNNDYGLGLADAFSAAYEEAGGSVTLVAAHEDGRADYSAEVGALASAGGEALVVIGYADQGGAGMIQAALDSGAFELFVLPDGMASNTLTDTFGADIDGSFGQTPGNNSEGAQTYTDMAMEAGFDGTSPFSMEAYDATALMLMAMQAAGSSDPAEYGQHIMDLANAPGTEIYPGQLGEALEMIAAGEEINYVGASAVELIEPGESAGTYRMYEVQGGVFETTGYR